MDVSGSRKSGIDLQVNLREDINLYGYADVRRYLICLLEDSGRKLKFLVKLEKLRKWRTVAVP